MIHKQLSIKFEQDTHIAIAALADKMRITPHKFIVSSVLEIQRMIQERDTVKIPLLVLQARTALDYENDRQGNSAAPAKDAT